MTPTQKLISELAHEHDVDPETIVRAAVVHFADGMGHEAQARVLRTVERLDAQRGDNSRHSPSSR